MMRRFTSNWDMMGILASLACAVHCAFLPLIMASLTVLGLDFLENVAFEYFMIILAAAVGFFSIWNARPWRGGQGRLTPFILMGTGILLLLAKQHWHGQELRILPFALASILGAHLLNLRHSASCKKKAAASDSRAPADFPI
jgi:hypothetical protein